MNNAVNIAMITDNNYVKPTIVALTSLFCHKKSDSVYNIFILTNDLNEQSINLLKSLKNTNFNISVIDKSNIIEKFNNLNVERHVTVTAILKFFLPEIFNDLDKILYLDSDILVQADLSELININIPACYAAVVKDILCKVNTHHMAKYNIPNKYYFNSGVLLLNLELMRRDNISDSLIDYRINKPNHFMDQDTFNAVIGHKVKYISYKYNFLNYYLEKLSIKELENFYEEKFESSPKAIYAGCYIVHLGGANKPWVYNMGYLSDLYRKYWNKSPLKNEKLVLKKLKNTNSFLQNIFSVRNDNNHKVVTVLWLKIKIKRGAKHA